MSLLYDLYFNMFLIEDKVISIRDCQEILDLEDKLKNILKDNFKIYKDIRFLLLHKLSMLMEDERELALKRGIKIGMEIQEYFATLLNI